MTESILNKYYPTNMNHNCIYPEFYTSIEEEYEAIRQNVGIIDGGAFGVYHISGEGSTEFLDRLATKEIIYLNVGMTSECLFLDEEANVVSVVFIEKFDEHYILIVPPDRKEAIDTWLAKNKQDDVGITDITATIGFFFIEGRQAWRLMKDLIDPDIESLVLRGIRTIELNGESVDVTRLSRTGEYGYILMGKKNVVTDLVDECFQLKDKYDIKLCGSGAVRVCMLEIRSINTEYETADKGNIFELAQQWLISYEKEDYIGATALKELFQLKREALTVGFVCDKDVPISENEMVYLENDVVGNVLYSLYSKGLDQTLGIVKLTSDVAVSGITLALKNETDFYEIHTISSPFLRPISWDEPME